MKERRTIYICDICGEEIKRYISPRGWYRSGGYEIYADDEGNVSYVKKGHRRKRIHICPKCSHEIIEKRKNIAPTE